jgi:hypothetical protein
MKDDRITWLRASAEAVSHRRMYSLALEILASETACKDLRRAAGNVQRTLKDAIDLPIADVKILAKGRKKFEKLQHSLSLPLDALG